MIHPLRHHPRFVVRNTVGALFTLELLWLASATVSLVQASPPAPRIATRVFSQDDEAKSLKWAAEFRVGGIPSKVIAVGGRADSH